MVRFSDEEIEEMIRDPKILPENFLDLLRLRPKRGHSEKDIDVIGNSGKNYRLILRQSKLNQLDFSIILSHCPEGTTQLFRICRFNGKSHQHTNFIEKDTFYDFHIHRATERYQDLGYNEEVFAERTSHYHDFTTALNYMLEYCSFKLPSKTQRTLFE